MRIFFFRHAEAEDSAANDFSRQLTARGSKRTQAAARALSKLGLAPAHIYSSPRVRARQTADILAQALGLSVEEREELNFGFDEVRLRQLLAAVKGADEVILVGHEPSLSSTVQALTGATIEMKKGGCARVDLVDDHPAVLIWLIAPKIFDALGE
ncbi:MAG: phosphohistidine phosphatase SixA [Chloroflexi bacterium]|nr:phosphohistidine phosphatase SixA [Chloroflexota bacterium]